MKFFWKYFKLDPNFQVPKIVIFDHIEFNREHFGIKTKAVLWNLWGKFPGRHKLLFWKLPKPLNFEFLVTSSPTILDFYQNYAIFQNSNRLEIFGENLSNLSRFEARAERKFFPYSIIYIEATSVTIKFHVRWSQRCTQNEVLVD